jgi:hypothetical protein
MSAFANLKKKSGGSSFGALTDKLKNEGKSTYESDDRYWKLEVDKAGNGFATIRFLDAPKGADGEPEAFPYVSMFEYSFQYKPTQKWYINLSRKTLGADEADPVDEAWADLWNQGRKDEAKQFSRSTRYVSNVLIVNDPKHPEHNGKVMLYKYGPRIFQKLQGAISPEFADEVAMNPFDMWTGGNFKLKARMLDGQRSYDKSEFESAAPISDDDAVIEKIWSKAYSLEAEIAPSKFKSYDQLKARFDAVIGRVGQATNKDTSVRQPAESPAKRENDDLGVSENDEAAVKQHEGASTTGAEDDGMEAYRRLLED